MTELPPPSASSRARHLTAAGFALFAVAAAAAEPLGAEGLQRFGPVVLGGAAVTSLLLATRRLSKVGTNSWLVLAASVALLTLGYGVPRASESGGAAPNWAIWVTLAGCVTLTGAVLLLGRVREDLSSRTAALDGAVIGSAAAMLIWVLLIAPDATGGDTMARFASASLAARDGLLVGILGWMVLAPGRRSGAARWCALAVAALLVTDVLAASDSSTSWKLAGAVEPFCLVAFAAFAICGVYATHDFRSQVTRTGPTHEHASRSLVIGVALLVGPIAAVTGDLTTVDGMAVIGVGSTALALGVMARFVNLVHQNQQAHEETASSERRFRMLAESAPVGIFEIARGMQITYANAESRRIFGSSLIGLPRAELLDHVAPESRPCLDAAIESLSDGTPVTAELQLAAPHTDRWVLLHGVPVRPATAGLPAAFASTLDITDLKEAHAALSRQATHDPLTGLPNRRFLIDALIQALRDLGRGHRTGTVALMFVDLDGFKLVNDVLGHDAGDALLKTATARLRNAVRAHDIVARFGGDEFVVLMQHVADRGELHDVAQRILDAVSAPIHIGSEPAQVGASIGIATASGPDDDADALVRNADAAMYRAKEHGRGRYEFFRPDARDEAHRML